MKSYLYIALLVLILLVGCAEQQMTPEQKTIPKEEAPAETIPIEAKTPAPKEPVEVMEIPNDIKEVLEKGKTKLKSYSYNYKSPESDIEYPTYVKGNKMKIILPQRNVREDGKFYNTIYLDMESKTAEAYCIGYSACDGNIGKMKDLNYEEEYSKTPLEWLAKVTEAQQIDERQIEGRDSLYLETNIGKITVESYYGFLYLVEDGGNKWEFRDAAFNSVTDDEVTPS